MDTSQRILAPCRVFTQSGEAHDGIRASAKEFVVGATARPLGAQIIVSN